MFKIFRMATVALAAVIFTASLASAAQATPTPAPDSGPVAAPSHRKGTTSKKHSNKKASHKKGKKKAGATPPK
jgi:hypothetical protein